MGMCSSTQHGWRLQRPRDSDRRVRPALLQSAHETVVAQGCQKIKKMGRGFADELLDSPVYDELISMIRKDSESAMAGHVIAALVTLSVKPAGRHRLSMAGLVPLAKQ